MGKANENLPIIFDDSISNVSFERPESFEGAAKNTITAILNACKKYRADKETNIYFSSDYVHIILRTTKENVKRIIFELEANEKIIKLMLL